MLSEGLYYPARGDDVVGTALVGGVLCLLTAVFALAGLAALVVPPLGVMLLVFGLGTAVVLLGYTSRLMSAVANGHREPPSFTRWGRLVRDGVRAFVALVALWVPVVIFGGLAFGSVYAASVAEEPAYALVAVLLLLPLILIVGVTAYLSPTVLAVSSRETRAVDALAPNRFVRVGASVAYLKSWILAGAFLAVVLPVALLLSILLVGVPLVFYALMVAAALWGQGCGIALSLREPSGSGDSIGPVDREEFVRGLDVPVGVDRTEFVRSVPHNGRTTAERRSVVARQPNATETGERERERKPDHRGRPTDDRSEDCSKV